MLPYRMCLCVFHIVVSSCPHSVPPSVAILWPEMWHAALENASRLYFGDKNIPGMITALMPLHEVGVVVNLSNAYFGIPLPCAVYFRCAGLRRARWVLLIMLASGLRLVAFESVESVHVLRAVV